MVPIQLWPQPDESQRGEDSITKSKHSFHPCHHGSTEQTLECLGKESDHGPHDCHLVHLMTILSHALLWGIVVTLPLALKHHHLAFTSPGYHYFH